MNRTRWIAVAALTGLAACARGEAKGAGEGERPTPVRVAHVELDTLAVPITGTGTLAAGEELALSFKIGGVVRRVAVNPGDRVRAGQTLATLDPAEIDAGVARARSAAEKAERDLARARRLYADSVVPLAQLQDAETAAEIARADLERARFDRRHATIVAPSSGVVLRRLAEPGEMVAAGSPVVTLGSSRRGTVLRLGLADRDAVRVRRGDRATVRFDALPGSAFEGAVTEVGADAEPGTGTYAVEVTLEGAGGLASGLVGTAAISPRDRRPVAVMPVAALLEGDDRDGSVYVVRDDGRAERRSVELGFLAGDRIAVTSGLAAGDLVVTSGAAYLDDGAPVEVVR